LRSGWNPTRRNRKIGTGAQGHGADNRHVIPESWRDILTLKSYFERLTSPVFVERQAGPRGLTFVVEPARPGCFYPCTLDDISTVLSHCPAEHLDLLDLVVLRQPTRKQRIHASAWGRAVFGFDLGGQRWPAILLEAQTLEPVRWGQSTGPQGDRELERLRQDGHEVRRNGKVYEIHSTPEALRNTQLYRTVPHELGHLVDAERGTVEEWSSRSSGQKEDFAHRYAAERMAELRKGGFAPFPTRLDLEGLERDGLKVEWFVLG
jgi:hypothetical protein